MGGGGVECTGGTGRGGVECTGCTGGGGVECTGRRRVESVCTGCSL